MEGTRDSEMRQEQERWLPATHHQLGPNSDVFGDHQVDLCNSLGLFDHFCQPRDMTYKDANQLSSEFAQARGHHRQNESFSSMSSVNGGSTNDVPFPAASMLQRQDSSSNVSEASSYNGQHRSHEGSPTEPLRGNASPFGLPQPLHSMSGLAIGTPQHQIAHNFSHGMEMATFHGQDHSALLSLSGHEGPPEHHDMLAKHGNYTFPEAPRLMAPPPNKRRANQYGDDGRSKSQSLGSGLEDVTPTASTAHAFCGQTASSEVADLAAGRVQNKRGHAQSPSTGFNFQHRPQQMPQTPASASSSATVGQHHQQYTPGTPSHAPQHYSPFTFMTPQPSDLTRPSPEGTLSGMSSSISGSAFSAPRLARMDSFESVTSSSGVSSPVSNSEASQNVSAPTPRSLDAPFSDHDAKPHPSPQAAFFSNHQYVQQPNASLAMSRIASAPSHIVASEDSHQAPFHGLPSTPQRNAGEARHPQISPHVISYMQTHNGAVPATPSGQIFPVNQSSHAQFSNLTMSAPAMAASRSMSFLTSPSGMHSPAHSIDGNTAGSPFGTPSSGRLDYFNSPLASGLSLQSPLGGSSRASARHARGSSQSLGSVGAHVNIHGTPGSASGKGRAGGLPPLIVSSADKHHVCHCGKRFKRLEHLKRHSRVHTQERPHQCPAPGCNKWFGRTDNLTQHLRTHYRTMGRSSESLMSVTQSPSNSKGESGFEVPTSPFDGPQLHQSPVSHSSHSLSQAMAIDGEREARDNPHAAAAAAAARAVSKNQMKRRITVSNDMLSGPIALTSPHKSPTVAGSTDRTEAMKREESS